MIVSSIVNALKIIISKPALLVVVLISILFGKVLGQLTIDAWIPLSDIFTMWQSSTESPFIALIVSNPVEVIIIILAAIVSFTVSVIALEFLSRVVKKEDVVDAINISVLNWQKAFGVAFTLSVVSAILWFILMFFVQLGVINELISLILVLTLIIFTAFAFIKIVFVFPAMVEEKTAKQALQKSWNFLDNYASFGKAFLFLIMLGLVVIVTEFIFLSFVTILLQSGINEELLIDYTLPVIYDTFVTSFIGLAIASYYYSK